MEETEAVDLFGRHIEYIRISLTERCNLRCAYCVSGDPGKIFPRDDILKLKDITRLMEIYSKLGLRKVRLTGGEPLMRKGICTLIKDLKSIDGIDMVTMTSNGIMLEKMIPQLLDAGLDRINLSLDSLRPDRLKEVTGVDTYDKIMSAIHTIVDRNIWDLKVNVVAINGFNDDEILDFADMANSMPLELRFIEMMPFGASKMLEEKNCTPCVTADIEKKIRSKYKLIPIERKKSGGPAVVYGIEGGKGTLGFISPLSKHFCSSCNRMRLTAVGKLRSCLFRDHEVDLKSGLEAGENDEWFINRLLEAIKTKPEWHNVKDATCSPIKKSMVSIGG